MTKSVHTGEVQHSSKLCQWRPL